MSENIKVTYFFRKPQPQYFSIERVFEQVIDNLPEQISPVVYKLKNGTNGWWGRLKALIEVHKNKGQINHITGDITFIALALPKKGLVVTYHDLESLTQFTGWKFRLLKYLWVIIPVRRARVVTAISEHTKEQLINWTGCNPAKIVVVPNPLPNELANTPKVFNADNPTILVMGTKANKNVEGVFRAVGEESSQQSAVNIGQSTLGSRQLPDGDKGHAIINEVVDDKRVSSKDAEGHKGRCRVLVVGDMTEEQKKLAKDLNLEVENLVHVPYEQILDAYMRCDILCFPSFYEGFGLPIVEAQAIGRPVITSNFGAMKEVAGDGAILVCPNKEEQIAQAIQRVIADDEFRNRLIKAGLKNVERFDAKNVAGIYGEVYDRVSGC